MSFLIAWADFILSKVYIKKNNYPNNDKKPLMSFLSFNHADN